MKFERAKTEKSKKRLKRVFYFTFFIWLILGILRVLKSSLDSDIASIISLFSTLSVISFLIIFVLYVVHIFIEGLEKPKFIPTKIFNNNANENTSEADSDAPVLTESYIFNSMQFKRSRTYTSLFWLVIFLTTALDPFLQSIMTPSAVHISVTLTLAVLVFAWFITDAKETGYKPSALMKIGVAALAMVVVPIYLIKAKGYKRAGISFLKFLGLFSLMIGALLIFYTLNA